MDADQIVVTAQQMRDIEARIFAAGMPVAALMEKVGGLISRRIQTLISTLAKIDKRSPIGILVGPGHNGGDALVVARELHFQGYEVIIYRPFTKLKELTAQHAQYVDSLGIPCVDRVELLKDCHLLIDGLFGFGLERAIADPIASAINEINQLSKIVISIDLPSGLHTDTSEVLGTAIRANYTLCLGLWKLGLLQEQSLDYIGEAELIDFNISSSDIQAVIGNLPQIQRMTQAAAIAYLPLHRSPLTHKYKMGHLLLICGSRRYSGAAILTGLAARASGVGMLSIAVPESLKPLLVAQLPEALIIGCPETESGAIKQLPVQLDSYNAIACGPGLTSEPQSIVETVLNSNLPLILDADGLNILANLRKEGEKKREAVTIITPHAGEFKRLFPDIDLTKDRINAVKIAAQQSGTIVLLKGARTAISHPNGSLWINPESTPALARGGSGDVLTGLMGGLVAQTASKQPIDAIVSTAAWWHAQAGILAAQERTELGVDAFTLTQYLLSALVMLSNP